MRNRSGELTPKQLRRLPLRGLVALLARNARRVQPLFTLGPPDDLDPRNLQAIEHAIRAAEAFADGAAEIADDGTAAFGVGMRCSAQTAPVAFTAALAACSADHAAGVRLFPEAEGEALATAVQALAYFDTLLNGRARDSARADFAALLARSGPGSPAWGDPIDSSEQGILGALWPPGATPHWYTPGQRDY
jgi:hypothetical protein